MTDTQLPTEITPGDRRLTAAQFQGLAEVPPEIEWFANITNPGTRRIYKIAIREFMRFIGHRPAGGIPYRHPRACHRLAR
jgi:hypothetical protein